MDDEIGGSRVLDPQAVAGPCPCDECPTALKCASRGLCCQVFSLFVAGHGPRIWERHDRVPNHERYVRVFGLEGTDHE